MLFIFLKVFEIGLKFFVLDLNKSVIECVGGLDFEEFEKCIGVGLRMDKEVVGYWWEKGFVCFWWYWFFVWWCGEYVFEIFLGLDEGFRR